LPVDVTAVMATYLVFMEFNSIMENLDKMGVPVPAFFKKRVNNTLSQFDDEGE
jgi:phage-related holin